MELIITLIVLLLIVQQGNSCFFEHILTPFVNKVFSFRIASDNIFQRQYDKIRALPGKYHGLSFGRNTITMSILIEMNHQIDKNILVNYFSAGKSKILKN